MLLCPIALVATCSKCPVVRFAQDGLSVTTHRHPEPPGPPAESPRRRTPPPGSPVAVAGSAGALAFVFE